MKTFLIGLLCASINLRVCAQAPDNPSIELAASFDKNKAKIKSKSGVTTQRSIVTHHTVVDAADLTTYSGRYIGIDGRYEITLAVGAGGKIRGQLLKPTANGPAAAVELSNVRIRKGVFTAEDGSKLLEGIFLKQIRIDNGQERTSLGLGIVNPDLPTEGVHFPRIFCAKEAGR